MPKLQVSEKEAQAVLGLVTEWMHKHYGLEADSPSREFYTPKLVQDFDWTSEPTPALVLELGDDWAIYASAALRDQARALGLFLEPYSAWALCVYPA